MPSDLNRIDSLIQYALLVVGEQDEPFDRQLGPVHLIKYVYLADLAYAQRNDGKTFTGVDWQFYKFGPWSQVVNERIEPALHAMGADKKAFESDYENRDEWFRWSLRSAELLKEKESTLPAAIQIRLRPIIREFGKDTSRLLDHVYRTLPMIKAAPGEYLNFAGSDALSTKAEKSPSRLRMDTLDVKAKKRFAERMNLLRKMASERHSQPSPPINPVKNARYDDIYQAGLAWLDELAGDPVPLGEQTVDFSEDVWRSPTRTDKDVS